ncbi:MAG TPA: amidohydrolase family protein, partial [Chitinophagaceae bacterium]
TGNCGSSNLDVAAYLRFIDSLKLSINVATLVGHNDVREKAMGKDARDPTPQETREMESIVEKAMRDGAVGFSTGLIYTPGNYSKTPEIVGLAKIAARYHGVYTTHMRDEGDSVTEAIEEALQVATAANIPLEISHFKLSGQQNWGRSKETVPMIENARKRGIDVTIDQYPYTASSTSISTLLPDEILANGQDSVNARLSRPDIRKYVTTYILGKLKKRKLSHLGYAVIANYETDSTYNGKSIEQVNLMLGRRHTAASEAETVMDIMMHGGATAVFHGMSEEDVRRIMKYPYNMFASDASIRQFGVGVPHPRGYGTNARVLAEYVRKQHVISLEDAVRRMTSLPAQKFGLHDRGIIAPGYAADLVIFDEATVQDRSTYAHPHAYSTGFQVVIVNGRLTVEGGKHLGVRAGQALYGPGANTKH